MTSIALVTTENLPESTAPCSGGGVRIAGLGEALRRAGLNPVFYLLESWRETLDPRSNLPVEFYEPYTLRDRLESSGCAAVLFEQWQPMTFLREPLSMPVCVDLPGPLALEYHWRDPANALQHMRDKLRCLAQADFALCAVPRQYGYYAAWLHWAGFDPGRQRLEIAPFHMREMPRSRSGRVEDEPQLMWGGRFWPWHDRTDAFELTVQALDRAQRGQLAIVGAEGGEAELPEVYKRYADHPRVTWLGSCNFTDYVSELKRSDAALDLSAPNLERSLSSDLRCATALWAGAPCIVTPQSAWANLITATNAGWVMEYQDKKTLATTIKEIVTEKCDIVAKRRGAAEASSQVSAFDEKSAWLSWFKHPVKRDTKDQSFFDARELDREKRLQDLQNTIDLLSHEKKTLESELDSIRSNPLFRLYKKITKLFR